MAKPISFFKDGLFLHFIFGDMGLISQKSLAKCIEIGLYDL
jgi:hypothetical protein